MRGNNREPIRLGSGSQSVSLMKLTAALAAAYVSRTAVAQADVPIAIKGIHAALLELRTGTTLDAARGFRSSSEIAKSIQYDCIISFIDGKRYKSIKRHLTAHGMTPGDYRRRYGLPRDYPLVSPDYAMVRSRIAKQIYHGRKAA